MHRQAPHESKKINTSQGFQGPQGSVIKSSTTDHQPTKPNPRLIAEEGQEARLASQMEREKNESIGITSIPSALLSLDRGASSVRGSRCIPCFLVKVMNNRPKIAVKLHFLQTKSSEYEVLVGIRTRQRGNSSKSGKVRGK